MLAPPALGLLAWVAVDLRRPAPAVPRRRDEWIFVGLFLVFLAAWRWPDFLGEQQPAASPAVSARWPQAVDVPQPVETSFPSPETGLLRNRSVLRLYTPGKMSWVLDGTEREFRFEYGFLPEAYLRGKTNGAAFVVELVDAGQTRQVYRRDLDPVHVDQDRAHQFSRVVLPPFRPGTELVLRLDPGALGDTSWDWLYACNIGFHRSRHFLRRQFPSFSRVPDAADTDLAYLYQRNGEPEFLQLNAPSALTFRLRGGEKQLAFTYGFLPGAYREGHTDGAGFSVELIPSSAPGRRLFGRLLQPLTAAADRGPQQVTLTLPPVASGDRLVIRLDAGPAGNNSWDWTYVDHLTLD